MSNLTEMIQARRELAELEWKADVSSSKRLALAAGVGAVIALTSLPLFAGTLAQVLHTCWPFQIANVNLWHPTMAAVLLLAGTGLAWVGYRRFRREFIGFRQSLEEVREDIEWLREWTGRAEEAG
jgi:uncharacterized membrane protein YqjE